MIARVIEFSIRNRFVVILATIGLCAAGVYAVARTPVDAIPDLSENQVIVWADWPGRSPREIEDQITYPLSVRLQGLAGVKSVRATSEFGFSMINVIFEDAVDFYFARQRVLERLSTAGSFLPAGVVPYMAPDATALGQIFWYTVEGKGKSLDELRSIQDWYVRYQLNAVAGVAEVSSVGGFVREYQIDVQPEKLRAYDLPLGQVFQAVMGSNSSVGGKVIQKGGAEYLVRGTGWIRNLEDIRDIVVAERRGVPITVEQLGTVQIGPAFRRSVLEKNDAEAVGGVVMMRFGENPLEVTDRVKAKIRQLQAGLPPGVRIVPFYDRTGLIHAAIDTLTSTLIEEILIASVVVFLVLWHLRSALVICVTLPLAVFVSFILMNLLKIPSNIMSLSGIAISIGVLVDAGIVMTENAYHRLHDHFQGGRVTGDTRDIVADACKVVGGPIFFSILIMLLSFAPIFVLGGMEGKMFNPLAWTKSFALVGVAILAVTLLPAILPTFVRGKLKSQEDVWLVRSFVNIYKPMLTYFLKHPDVLVVITGLFLLAGIPVFPRKVPWIYFVIGVPFIVGITAFIAARRKAVCLVILLLAAGTAWQFIHPLGEEFMPPLDELAIMDMPTTIPSVNITQAGDDLRARDAIIRTFPEVHQVVGKAGRAETPTDPAPIDMVETVVSLRPKTWWPKRKVFFEDVRAEAVAVCRALRQAGILKPLSDADVANLANSAAMDAQQRLDRGLRELSYRRLQEDVRPQGTALVRRLRTEFAAHLRARALLKQEPADGRWAVSEEKLAGAHASQFHEWILLEDVTSAARELADFLRVEGAVPSGVDLFADPASGWGDWRDPLAALIGEEPDDLFERLQKTLLERQDALVRDRVRRLNWELQDRAPEWLAEYAVAECLAHGESQRHLARQATDEERRRLQADRERVLAADLRLWPMKQDDVRMEMDSELQFPGWGNIWTRPIQNRVDMLATGVRTAVGVKVFGEDLETIQKISEQIASVLKGIPGAVDVFPDQIVGENYLEIAIDRKKAARYGVSVEAIQNVIEVALGGKEVTTTIEGRQRYPVRVRYPRDWREDEESVRNVLIPVGDGGGSGMSGGGTGMAPAEGGAWPGAPEGGASQVRLRQVPLAAVADVKIVPGPSMIKSENGLLRSYVQLNVRERDIVGFVEEARRTIEEKVALPPGYYLEWSGQFEHQVRAQKTLKRVFPAVVLIIFVILYLTYRDLPDTAMMFLAVPGAVAGGALFQWLCPVLGITDRPVNFSVAVWVGYIACFGLATETGIVMLVYLREAIDRRGGMEKIRSEEEIREAVIDGAVHRLRPKLLTEGTTLLALIPMLWATGVGSEFTRPMAAPIVGGILVADEVIDILIPVLFYQERCRRLRKRLAAEAGRS